MHTTCTSFAYNILTMSYSQLSLKTLARFSDLKVVSGNSLFCFGPRDNQVIAAYVVKRDDYRPVCIKFAITFN